MMENDIMMMAGRGRGGRGGRGMMMQQMMGQGPFHSQEEGGVKLDKHSAAAAAKEEEKGEEPKMMKIEWNTEDIVVKCKVLYLDFEGRSKAKDIKGIISQVKPRKVVIIHGTNRDKKSLKTYCERPGLNASVYIPKNGKMLDIMSETGVVNVELPPELLQRLSFQSIKNTGYEIAWLDSQYTEQKSDDDDDDDDEEEEQKTKKGKKKFATLQPAPYEKIQGHTAVFLGNIKFAELKRFLITKGHNADFHGGIMVCDDRRVTIRKEVNEKRAKIRVQGTLCSQYFKVRDLIYEQYSIL